MHNVETLSPVSIAARRSRVRSSGRPTLPASQRPRNTKSPCTQALKRYVAALDPRLISSINAYYRVPDQTRDGNQKQRTLLVSIINHLAPSPSQAGRASNTPAIVPRELIALLWDHHFECHPSTHPQWSPLRLLVLLWYVYLYIKLRSLNSRLCRAIHRMGLSREGIKGSRNATQPENIT